MRILIRPKGRRPYIRYWSTATHGGTGTSTFVSWKSMRDRVLRPNCTSYDKYGGRGIKICERWDKFENFLVDMGPRPEGKTLNRINNNGNYEPSNCEWATAQEQALNRNNRLGASGLRGVSYYPQNKKYMAKIWLNNKHINLGLFKTAEEAGEVVRTVREQVGLP